MPPFTTVSRTLLVRQQTGIQRAALPIAQLINQPSLWSGIRAAVVLEEPIAIFDGGGITMTVGLWRATIANALVEDISEYLVAGSVDLNLDRSIKLAAKFTIRSPEQITPFSDFLAPFIQFDYDDGSPSVYQQIGLYAISVPPGTYTIENSEATFDGSDLTSVMATSILTDAYNVAGGTNVATAIIALITSAGITRYNIPTTTRTTSAAWSFKIGSSRLDAANELCRSIGWYELGMDLDGKVSTPGPSRPLTSVEPFRSLTDGDLLEPLRVEPTGNQIANLIVVVNDDATAAPLTSTATNTNPASPTSTVALNRTIGRTESLTGSVTQADLDAYAARLLSEGASYYRVGKVKILPDPNGLTAHQTVRLTLTGKMEDMSGLWWVRAARLGLSPDSAPLELEVNQVTSDLVGGSI